MNPPAPGVAVCHSCGSVKVHKHCETRGASTCDWIVCDSCKSYGKVDGSRWHDARKVAS